MDGMRAACVVRLGADAELKYSQAGKPLLQWRMAVTDTRQQERGAQPEWVKCTAFGDLAESLAEGGRLVKGAEVYAEGRLTLARWEKDGEQRSGLELAAFVVQVLGLNARGLQPNGTVPVREPVHVGALSGSDEFADVPL
jgi:single-strand DNA-binding protein